MRVSAPFSQIIVALRSHVLLAEGTPLAYVRSVVTNFSFSLHYLMQWKDVYFCKWKKREITSCRVLIRPFSFHPMHNNQATRIL